MDAPRPDNLAHDLRNLLGLVRALSAQLPALVEDGPSETADPLDVARELDLYTRYAMDALWLVEKWSTPEPVRVHLGAWAWALRLTERDLVLGDLAGAPATTAVVPRALAAGQALLRAIGGPKRRVAVELAPHREGETAAGGLSFETASGAVDAAALARAVEELTAAGLVARVAREMPCRVEVLAPPALSAQSAR